MQTEMFTPAEMGSPLVEELGNLSDRLRALSADVANDAKLERWVISARVFQLAQELESLNLYYHGAD